MSGSFGFTVRRIRFTIEAMCLGIALLAIDVVIWKTDLSGYGVWVMVQDFSSI